MTATSGTMSYLLDEVVSFVAMDEFTQLPTVMPLVYGQRESSMRRERSASFSALGQFSQKNELAAPSEDEPVQQFEKTFTHNAFALTVPVSRELIDDEEWGWFQDLGLKIGESANRTIETLAAALFIDMPTGATYLAEDGLSIANNAHINVDGGNSQDNLLANTLTVAGVKATRTAMRKFTDYRGEKITINPDVIVCPVDLEQDAWEIVRSSLKPGSANNDANFYNGMFDLVVWRYLTDTNDWVMGDSALMRRNLLWFWRIGLEIYGDGDLFAGKRRIGGYFRQSHGCKDWRCVAYNQNS